MKELIFIAIIIAICCIAIYIIMVSRDTDSVTTDDVAFQKKFISQSSVPSPARPVKLIFIHHSCGSNWLQDDDGGLGIALRDNNYFVSDTNYLWGMVHEEGSAPIGSLTDIGHWYLWFRSPKSPAIMEAVYRESGQHASYSRLNADPGGNNRIVMFKSCFPNSNLRGNPGDPIPPIESNPLKGIDSASEYHTVANAKGIYIDLLPYFRQHQETLFVAVTAPPVSGATYSANARAFNQWMVNDWLKEYPSNNVVVFDFYNVLTTNRGNTQLNDLSLESGNHHRWWNEAVQHKADTDGSHNTTAYPLARRDDHPNRAGNQKATGEFVPLLNLAYQQWQSTNGHSLNATTSEK